MEWFGPPSTVRYCELAPPVVDPADMLVAVAVSAVNRTDIFVRSGIYRTPVALTFTLGRDPAGEAVAANLDVGAFRCVSALR